VQCALGTYDYCKTLIGNHMLEVDRGPMTTVSSRNDFNLEKFTSSISP